MKAPAVLPEDPQLAAAFEKKCLSCHAVGDKGGTLGPNLTGIGNKQAVAGILLNDETPVEENLKTWIEDPVKVKPGSKMPKVTLSPEELDGISKYLANYKLQYDNGK